MLPSFVVFAEMAPKKGADAAPKKAAEKPVGTPKPKAAPMPLGPPGDFNDLSVQPFNSHARAGTLMPFLEAVVATEDFMRENVSPHYKWAIHKRNGRHSAFLLIRLVEARARPDMLKSIFANFTAAQRIHNMLRGFTPEGRSPGMEDELFTSEIINALSWFHCHTVGIDCILAAFILTAQAGGGEEQAFWAEVDKCLDAQLVVVEENVKDTFMGRKEHGLSARTGWAAFRGPDSACGTIAFKILKRGRFVHWDVTQDTIRRYMSPDRWVVIHLNPQAEGEEADPRKLAQRGFSRNPRDLARKIANPLNRGPYGTRDGSRSALGRPGTPRWAPTGIPCWTVQWLRHGCPASWRTSPSGALAPEMPSSRSIGMHGRA